MLPRQVYLFYDAHEVMFVFPKIKMCFFCYMLLGLDTYINFVRAHDAGCVARTLTMMAMYAKGRIFLPFVWIVQVVTFQHPPNALFLLDKRMCKH